MLKLHCNVNFISEDVTEHLINYMEVLGVHGVAEVLFIVGNDVSAAVATAHRSLFVHCGDTFKDPLALRALVTEELSALLAVVSDVLEVKFALALLVLAILRACGFGYQLLDLRLCRKIQGRMSPCVFDLNVNASRKEALEHFLGPAGSCLMHSRVAMLIDIKRAHVLLEQDPHDLVVTLVAGPGKRGVLSDLLSVLRFYERIVLLLSKRGRARVAWLVSAVLPR